MSKLTPEQYSRALQDIHKNYTNLRRKSVQSKLSKEEMQEQLAEFHEPVISSIQETGEQLDSRLEKQADAIEHAAETIQSIAEHPRQAIAFGSTEESDSEFYSPSATPDLRTSKKRKLTREVLSGHIDFDKPPLAVMVPDDDFYAEFGLPKLNEIYMLVIKEDEPQSRMRLVEHYKAQLFPHLLKLSQSLAGKKKQGKVWNESEILQLLNDSYLVADDRKQLEERLCHLRKQKFVTEYRNGFKLMENNISNPTIIQVQYGKGCQVYTNLDDMVSRLVLIRGNIEGGNNSVEVINEARALCDQLYKYRAISKKQYIRLYEKFTP